jgi:hypothetical protein
VLAKDKCSTLFGLFVSDEEKKFCNKDNWSHLYKLFAIDTPKKSSKISGNLFQSCQIFESKAAAYPSAALQDATRPGQALFIIS